jgi:hypothetical protein
MEDTHENHHNLLSSSIFTEMFAGKEKRKKTSK